MIICDVGPLWGHLSTHRGPKRPFLGPTRSSEGPGGPRRAPGGLIYSQLPQAGPNGWVTPISCALVPLTWYWAFFLRPSAPNGPFLAQNARFRFYRGPRQPKWGPIKPNDPHPPAICWLGCNMNSLGHVEPQFQPQGPQKGYLALNP